MKALRIIAAFLLLFILGAFTALLVNRQEPIDKDNSYIDEELLPYVLDSLQTLEDWGADMPTQPFRISLVNRFKMPQLHGAIAIAFGMNNDSVVYIQVSKEKWCTLSETSKRWVMLHELGHDIFNMKHKSNEIMRPYVNGDETHRQFEQAKVDMKRKIQLYYGR